MLKLIERQIKKFNPKHIRATLTEPAKVIFQLECRKKHTKKNLTKRGRMLILPNDQKVRPFEKPKYMEVAVSVATFAKSSATKTSNMTDHAAFYRSFTIRNGFCTVYRDANGYHAFEIKAAPPCPEIPKDCKPLEVLTSKEVADQLILQQLCDEKPRVAKPVFIGDFTSMQLLVKAASTYNN